MIDLLIEQSIKINHLRDLEVDRIDDKNKNIFKEFLFKLTLLEILPFALCVRQSFLLFSMRFDLH